MLSQEEIIRWLLKGDPSIVYQTHRDLLGQDMKEIQMSISTSGWGRAYLDARNPNGHWGQKFYQPKWTSTHYTLLDLRNLSIDPNTTEAHDTIEMILKEEKAPDGGIRPIGEAKKSDLCIDGMFLNYACYFGAVASELKSIVDCILLEQMGDGGFNCMSTRSGAHHSSVHTSISVLEGFTCYLKNGYQYRKKDIQTASAEILKFLLIHRLFKSDKTGEIIHKDFLRLAYPGRWRYDILRALDAFRDAGFSWDERMQDAIDVLREKRRKDGRWNLNARHPGQTHFEMEKAGKASRWNTLRVLRVFKHFGIE